MNIKPFISHKVTRFILLGMALTVFSVGMAYLCGYIARYLLIGGSVADLGTIIMVLFFSYIGSVMAGVIIIRYVFRQKGSILLGIIAAIIWAGLAVLIAAIFSIDNDIVSTIVFSLFLSMPFAAMGGFYLKRSI